MHIAVLGAGGLGGFLGARLAGAGHAVTFVARGDNLKALRTHGIRLQEPESDVLLTSVSAVEDPRLAAPADAVVVGVKSWQVPDTGPLLKPLMHPHTVVLTVQNGVEAPGHLARSIAARHLLGGTCTIAAYRAGPGHIHHFGGRPWMTMGPVAPAPGPLADTTARLTEALCAAGVECRRTSDIQRALWLKFLFVTSYGGVGAVARMPVGVTRTLPETRQMVEAAMHEVLAVGRTHGVALDESDVPAMMRQYDALPPDTTTSMQRDLTAGRRSELPDLNGAVVRLAAGVGMSARVHAFIYGCLLPTELRATGGAVG